MTTHTSPTEATAESWGQTSGQTGAPAHQCKLLRGQHRDSTLVLLHLGQMPDLTQLKLKAAPDWPSNKTETKDPSQQAKRAIANDWNEGHGAQPQ